MRGRRLLLSGLAVALAVIASCLVASPAPVSAAADDCQVPPGVQVHFCDTFDGTALETGKWDAHANDGTITVADGWAALTSSGVTFPYVVAKGKPFPDSGYRLTARVRFPYSDLYGVGVYAGTT